jgi:hypothetical protein
MKRFGISVIALFVASMLLGMVVHGMLLHADYLKLTGLFRSEQDAQAYFGWMLLAHVFFAIGFTWIYRGGRTTRPWLGQGVRFGLALALLTIVPTYLIYYAVQPIPGDLVAKQLVLDLIATVILGIVAAAVNRDPLVALAPDGEPLHA